MCADCQNHGRFEEASAAAKTVFVPTGAVVVNPVTEGGHLVCLGIVGGWAHVAWPMKATTTKLGETFLQLVTTPDVTFKYVYLYDWESYNILPTEAICPARQSVLDGFRFFKDTWRCRASNRETFVGVAACCKERVLAYGRDATQIRMSRPWSGTA